MNSFNIWFISDFKALTNKSNTQRRNEKLMKILDLSHIGNTNEPEQGDNINYTQETNDIKSGKEDNRTHEQIEQNNEPTMGVDMRKNISSQIFESQITGNKMNVGATRILPHLYLGSQKDVMNQVSLKLNLEILFETILL